MKRSPLRLLRAALLLAALTALAGSVRSGASPRPLVPRAAAPQAATATVLHIFDPTTEGYSPAHGLTQGPDGSLYGITTRGPGIVFQTAGPGTVFQIAPDGTFHTLHQFSSRGTKDGSNPVAKLLLVGNKLFGTCFADGLDNGPLGLSYGTVFVIDLSKVSPTDNAAGFSVIHYFASSADGGRPKGALFLASDGNLYGTTSSTVYPVFGPYPYGSIFQIKPDSGGQFSVTPRTTPSGMDTFNGSYTVIYDFFSDLTGSPVAAHRPLAGVVQGPDGFLYGTTEESEPINGGAVYKIGTDGSGFALLHSFVGLDGADPRGVPLFASDGSLYATTAFGGQADYYGVVFQIQPGADGVFSANAPFQVIHDFSDPPAATLPADELIQASDGNLYGAFSAVGSRKSAPSSIFRIAASSGQFSAASPYSTIHSFVGDNNEGRIVSGPLLQGQDGRLYGETSYNSDFSDGGTVFALDAGLPAPPAVSGIAGSIAPPDATTADTTLIVHGRSFNGGDKVAIDGLNVPVTSRDYSKAADEQITVTLSAPLRAGAHTVVIADTAPGIRASNPVAFLVTLLSPRIIQITRGGGGSVTTADTMLVINGDSFTPTDVIGGLSGATISQKSLNGSGSQFTLTLSKPLAAGHYAVTDTHAAPDGRVSNTYDLEVVAASPVLAPVTGLELTVNNSVPVSGVILTPGGAGFSGTADLMQINPDPNSLPDPSSPAAPRSAGRAAPASTPTGNSPIIDHVKVEVGRDSNNQAVSTHVQIDGSNFDATHDDRGQTTVTVDGQAQNAFTYTGSGITVLNPNTMVLDIIVISDNAPHTLLVTNPDGKRSQVVSFGVINGHYAPGQLVNGAYVPGPFTPLPTTSYHVSIRETSLVGGGTSIGLTAQSLLGSDLQKVAIGESRALAGVKLLGQDGASVAVQGGGNAVARAVASVISNDGGSVISNDGGSLLAKKSAGLIGQDGAGLIGQDGAGLITNDGAGLLGQDGAGLAGGNVLTGAGAGLRAPSSFRASAPRTASPAATTSKGFMDVTLFVSQAEQGMRLLVTRYTPGERDLILYKDPSVTVTPSAGTPAPVAAAPSALVVTRGPVTRDFHTHQPFQVLTLTNTGTGVLAGPFLIGLTGLPVGVTVAGPSSVLAGSPAVSMPGGALAPSASVRVRVDFADPTNVRFSYGTAVYAGL